MLFITYLFLTIIFFINIENFPIMGPNITEGMFLYRTNNIIKDKNRLVTDSSIISNTFNNYFINITNTLNLKPSKPKSKSLSDLLKLYEDHLSVLKIKENYEIQNKFQFREVSTDEVRKIIQP